MSEGQRRLAAIMFTDMVGFTALTQSDEAQSLAVLERHNRLLRPIFPKFHGREVKTIGDSFLVEFDSALDAMNCAVEVQRFLHDYNISSKDEWKITLRIGIHLGDVVQTGGDVFGDAVNIASRLQPLAEPEGVCISEQVFDQVRNKIPQTLVRMAPQELKNVRFPVDVYKVVMPWEKESLESVTQLDTRRIAVLPFVSMSPDPNDEYFADGLTEEMIGRLSLVKGLEVIARTSVMGFKKKEKTASQIGRDLRVGTLLEGSVRKAGNRIRVTAQLIDANTEGHLWIENYDRDLQDIFAVQSELAGRIADSLELKLTVQDKRSLQRGDTPSPEAHTMYLKATQLLHQSTESSLKEAVALFEGAISRDPKFARAYAGLAEAWSLLAGYAGMNPTRAVQSAEVAARRAMELEPELAEAHAETSRVNSLMDRNSEAIREAEVAISLNPSLSSAYESLGLALASLGRLEETAEALTKACELDPLSFSATNMLVQVLRVGDKPDRAWKVLEDLKELHPSHPLAYFQLAIWYRERKDFAKAQESLDAGFHINPGEIHLVSEQGVIYALTNRKENAEKQLSLIRSYDDEDARLFGEVWIQTALGNLDEAFKALMKQAEAHDWWWLMKNEPLFAELRKDPRFAEFCRKVGIPL